MAGPKTRLIEVFANPYSGIAEDGVPQGVVTMPGTRNYIGAHLDQVACEQTGKSRFYYAPPEEGEIGAHGLRKVTVPFTPEIARAVLEGGLIVDDEEHARMCGLTGYVDAGTQLEAEMERAASEWEAHYGVEAKIGPIPLAATKRPDPLAGPADAKAALVDLRTLPVLKGTPLAGPANNPSLVIRPTTEGV
jgi:hypothetical protein